MTDKQTFLLGVGAQKAGTSWLWSYLKSHRDVALPEPKELHIFDAMLRPEAFSMFKYRAHVQHLGRSPWRKIKDAVAPSNPLMVSPEQRIAMIEDPQVYCDFFRGLDPSARVVGEITPSYAALRPEHFALIKELLEPHFDVRIVVLLRDPVRRSFSAASQYEKVYRTEFPMIIKEDPNSRFESLMLEPYMMERQDYRRLLEGLDQVFAPEQVHVDFYERLFTPHTVQAINDFLGLEYTAPDFDKRVNAGPTGARICPDLAARAREIYAPIYTYCRERFGAEVIDDLWMAGPE